MGTVEQPAVQGAKVLGKCGVCSIPLPLRLPEIHEQASEWVCTGCGAHYRGIFLRSWPSRFQTNVRPAAAASRRPPSPGPPDRAGDSDDAPPRSISIAFPDHGVVRCSLETDESRELDSHIRSGSDLRIRPGGEAFAEKIRNHGDRPYDEKSAGEFRELLRQAAMQVGGFFADLESKSSASMHVAESISRSGLEQVAEDRDLLVNLGLTAGSSGYPSQHALSVAMLAMSVGTTMGWDEPTLLDLGVGCLVHDVGMLGVDRSVYENRRILGPADLAEIAKHPVHVFGILGSHLDRISPAAQMVAYQMHERCNGTGYPRGYTSDRIHDLAKVAAVADVFVALVSPRPHRPGMVAHHALKKILQDANRCVYDADAVRGLLNTVSLFPIGSYVALSDGQVGRVIRAGTGQYDRPIVEAWAQYDSSVQPGVINLAARDDLKITNTIAKPDK